MGELPMWARLVTYLGFPIIVAMVLLQVVVAQTKEHDNKLTRHIQNSSDTVSQLVAVMRANCINSARDAVAITRCKANSPEDVN